MTVVVVGVSHRDVPIGLLERMTVPRPRVPKALADLAGRDHLSEAVILSTCHRTEVYAAAERYHGAVQDIRNFLSELAFLAPEDFSDQLVTYHDDGAVSHLFSVAAGLESVVTGESQILGQVRTAWEAAREEGTCGTVLDGVFRHALETGKRVRSGTAIGRGVVSLSQAAVELARDRLGSLDGCRIAVLGAGEMGEGVASGVAAAQAADGAGGADVVVASRTRDRARRVAEQVGGRAVALDQLDEVLEEVDLLVTSTGSPSVVVTMGQMAEVAERRGGRPLLVVDMGMPRDVDAGVGRLPGVTLLDLADLRVFVDAGLDLRQKEATRARAIVAAEVARFQAESVHRQAAPTIGALRAHAEGLRQAELARHRGRLAGLDARQREAVEALTRGLLGKLLHKPTMALKESAGSVRGERLAEATRELFGV